MFCGKHHRLHSALFGGKLVGFPRVCKMWKFWNYIFHEFWKIRGPWLPMMFMVADDVYVSVVMFMVIGDVYEMVMFMVFGDVYEMVMYYWKW